MYRVLFILLILSLVSACRDTSKPFTVDKNDVTVTLPGYISEEELAEDAILEYANRYRNFYIAGFEMSQDISDDSARNLAAKRIYSSLDKYEQTFSKDQDSNLRTLIKGKFKNEPDPIFYYQKIIHNSAKRYLLTIWIRGEERHKKYVDDIESILYSFKFK